MKRYQLVQLPSTTEFTDAFADLSKGLLVIPVLGDPPHPVEQWTIAVDALHWEDGRTTVFCRGRRDGKSSAPVYVYVSWKKHTGQIEVLD